MTGCAVQLSSCGCSLEGPSCHVEVTGSLPTQPKQNPKQTTPRGGHCNGTVLCWRPVFAWIVLLQSNFGQKQGPWTCRRRLSGHFRPMFSVVSPSGGLNPDQSWCSVELLQLLPEAELEKRLPTDRAGRPVRPGLIFHFTKPSTPKDFPQAAARQQSPW